MASSHRSMIPKTFNAPTGTSPVSGRRQDAPRPQHIGPTRAKWIPAFWHFQLT